jgi:FixJ family two-component response regulator
MTRSAVPLEPCGVVFIVDDDISIRDGVAALIRSVGLAVQVFASAPEFLRFALPDVPACLVLDVRLPGLSGLDLQRDLSRAGVQIPIIFISGHANIPMTVRAMKAGAVEFLPKPFREKELLDAVHQSLDNDRAARKQRVELTALRARLGALTIREHEVLFKVTRGLLNKQIAGDLGITEMTIKVHRRHIMEKTQASSLAELVRMVEKLT